MKRESKNSSNTSVSILKKSNTTKVGGLRASAKFRDTYKEKWSGKSAKDNGITSRKSSVNLMKVAASGKMNEEESGGGLKKKIDDEKKKIEKNYVNGKYNPGKGKNQSRGYDEKKNVEHEEGARSAQLSGEEEVVKMEHNDGGEEEGSREISITRGLSEFNQAPENEGVSPGRDNVAVENGQSGKGVFEGADDATAENEDADVGSCPLNHNSADELREKYGQNGSRGEEECELKNGEKDESGIEDTNEEISYDENAASSVSAVSSVASVASTDALEEGQADEAKHMDEDAGHEKKGIYQNILKKLNLEKNEELESSHIIILGNKDVGKSSLVKSLQEISLQGDKNDGEVLYESGGGVLPLDYACLNVKNLEENKKATEVKGSSHVWILQHSSYVNSLIKNLKKFKDIKKVVILICTDLYKPYDIMSDINQWIDVLYVIFEKLHSDCNIELLRELKENLQNYVYNYKRDSLEKKKQERKSQVGGNPRNGTIGGNSQFLMEDLTGEDQINLRINSANTEENTFNVDREGLIKINMSFPILFVICKSDGYEILNNRTYQGYIDVIIAYLRNLAVNYQASIIFCNTTNKKEPKNVKLLYRYIMHRIYNFPFSDNAILDDYERVFVPSGYDDEELINQSIQNTFVENFNKPYDSIIVKPITNKSIVEHSHNIVADCYFNDFLANLAPQMESNGASGADEDGDDNNGDGRENDGDGVSHDATHNSVNYTDAGGDKIKIDVTLNGGTATIGNGSNKENGASKEQNDKSLHSFFQSLLAKGRSKSPSAPSITPQALDKKKKNVNPE
ncbi:dynein light intermediate chain 2, putative [Plasmodium knowlesi strain H]|uniref:Dynein light intermediate chain 2, putative n=3 Tax=Plasmodium knowlesi TaxID=5850 RepID=A0A5K1TVF3_PLAKH|nr:dynein intermediate light chain, putative [Plasmodium knowlesi strain H]OTN67390.1 putative Dynein light intermediate chain 2 [Plasmodium knowlesi]CAA9987332.1 dynein intermediate light chain, putative [Plasmodium knowlesi strain H]SBO23386.1 dynein light intermediate chain 2, putative [Plasmodium knowlesi strain H]SBO24617.1 dynein light intermediate chain 2, putative [Plasmodium knowlesi strain H]VVS76806.1 dynein intermediate light chain, putative [Plasmodium knowlesi strain H]|eukprot:XP_002258336.1 hypothetical protein, conserved in Plasmodium species [Plasmodium knowlesi strain H]